MQQLLFLFLLLMGTYAQAANDTYWKCYQSIVCQNQVCAGEAGKGKFVIKSISPDSVINNDTYHFIGVKINGDGPTWRVPVCFYGTDHFFYTNQLVMLAVAQGTFDVFYYANLPAANKNMHLVKNQLEANHYPESYVVCGYPYTESYLNNSSDCRFPPPETSLPDLAYQKFHYALP
jgi:hypothetical protein